MEWQAVDTDDLEPDDASEDDADQATRLDSGAGDLLQDPYIAEQLRQAQGDRLFELALHGLTEDEFGDGAIWLADED